MAAAFQINDFVGIALYTLYTLYIKFMYSKHERKKIWKDKIIYDAN